MQSAPRVEIDATGLKAAIIVSRFNETITAALLAGAKEALTRCGLSPADLAEVWVPGALELPLAAQAAATSGKFDCIVALGCVVRGETSHHLYVAGEAARGLARVSLETGVPIGFGVLTTDNIEQAAARAAPGEANKGAEAARSAVEMVHVLRRLRPQAGRGR